MAKKSLYLLAVSVILLGSCSSSDPTPDPDNGPVVPPEETIDDPAGTIKLSMRNNDKTSLNGLYIGGDDNFHGTGWYIVNVGPVAGLGNVYTIPYNGWSSQLSVTPGDGYVAYNRYDDEYYRLYVEEYILDATTMGVIGADVKYQKPFKGMDEEIDTDKSDIVFDAEGGSTTVTLQNSSIIPFKVTSSDPWCKVERGSTHDQWFLYDAVVITVDATKSGLDKEATVTIETLYGKKKTISVKQIASESFMTLGREEINFEAGRTKMYNSIELYTNINPEDIRVASTEQWVSAEISNERNEMPRKRLRWIGDEPLTRAGISEPVYAYINLTCEPNFGNDPRSSIITISDGNIQKQLKISQKGTGFAIDATNVEFEAQDGLVREIHWSGDINSQYVKVAAVNENENWCTVSTKQNTITLIAEPNISEKQRTASFSVEYQPNGEDGHKELLATINVSQKGMVYVDEYICFQSKSSNYSLYLPITSETVITSSADWCTATLAGNKLVIRASAAKEDRVAVVSFSNWNHKIYVSQSKYSVGCEYTVNGHTGKVAYMDGGKGLVFLNLEYPYSIGIWSNESVYIAGATSMVDGMANTMAIHALPNWRENYPAFANVDALNGTGETLWYLPAPDELAKADGYSQYYWSSANKDSNTAYSVYISTGSDGRNYELSKHDATYIKAACSFFYDYNSIQKRDRTIIKK